MGKNSAIEWTDHTWNPWYGCCKVSQGCKNCYMYRDMARTPFDPHIVTRARPATFKKPLQWKEPGLVFTCSWSDFFIEEADPWRGEALEVIAATPHLTYQILTKRPERVLDWLDYACWPTSGCSIDTLPPNVWLGVSVENQQVAANRIWNLCHIPARVRFISAEPLLGMVDLGFDALLADEHGHPGEHRIGDLIHWVITGGESGPSGKIRKAEVEWFRFIRDQCREAGVAYFHKQNGGNRKIDSAWGGRELDGKVWNEMPEISAPDAQGAL